MATAPRVARCVDLTHPASADAGAELGWSDLNAFESGGDGEIGDRDGRRYPEEVVGLVMRHERALDLAPNVRRFGHASANYVMGHT
jgi:hypothetical protein